MWGFQDTLITSVLVAISYIILLSLWYHLYFAWADAWCGPLANKILVKSTFWMQWHINRHTCLLLKVHNLWKSRVWARLLVISFERSRITNFIFRDICGFQDSQNWIGANIDNMGAIFISHVLLRLGKNCLVWMLSLQESTYNFSSSSTFCGLLMTSFSYFLFLKCCFYDYQSFPYQVEPPHHLHHQLHGHQNDDWQPSTLIFE